MQEIKWFDPKMGRTLIIGIIDGDTFYKKIDRKKHFIRAYKGFAIQSKAFYMMDEQQVRNVVFVEGKNSLTISFENFKNRCAEIDLGHGIQYVIKETDLTPVQF